MSSLPRRIAEPAVATAKPVASVHDIARVILVLRGQRVILDGDLAAIYSVTTKRLNEQVKRNAERFPQDFMFRLAAEESDSLRSVVAKTSSTAPTLSLSAVPSRPLTS